MLVDHRAHRIRPGCVGPYPEWQNYLRLNTEAGNLLGQRTSLMLLAKFAPIKR